MHISHDQYNICRWPKVGICNSSSKSVAIGDVDLMKRVCFSLLLFCFYIPCIREVILTRVRIYIYKAKLTMGKKYLPDLVWALRLFPAYLLLWEEHSSKGTQLLKQKWVLSPPLYWNCKLCPQYNNVVSVQNFLNLLCVLLNIFSGSRC